MAEALFARMRRITSGRAEDAIDRMEAANPALVMRETVREIERLIEKVRADYAQFARTRIEAERLDKVAASQLDDLNAKARFALEQGRDDLARGALERVLKLEQRQEFLRKGQEAAAAQCAELEATLTDLAAQRDEMKATLDTLRLRGGLTGTEVVIFDTPDKDAIERRVARARETFDRVNGFVSPAATTGLNAVAEIAALQADVEVDQRLAALKTAQDKPAKKAK